MKKHIFFIGALLSFGVGFSQVFYTQDGTLSSNRTVTMFSGVNSRNLTFVPSTANSQFFLADLMVMLVWELFHHLLNLM